MMGGSSRTLDGMAWGLLACALACNDFEREYPLEPSANLWLAAVDGQERLFFVTEDQRRRVRFRDLPGQRHDFIYTLHAHDAHSGRSLATTLLRERDADLDDGIGILGITDDLLWLWNEGVEARDPATLQVVLDTDAIRAANPELANLLPDESQRAGVSEALGSAVFQSLDARYFALDRSGTARPVTAEERVPLQEEIARYVGRKSRLVLGSPDEGVYGSVNLMRTTRQRVGNRLFEMLSDRKAEKSRRRDLSFDSGEGDVPLRIWLSDIEDRPDSTSLRPLGSPHQLLAGFVRDTRRGQQEVQDAAGALVVGESLLVLNKPSLSREAPWNVSRVGLDGRVLWETGTGIADPTRLLATDRVLILGGYRDFQEPTRLRRYRLVFFDLETGGVEAISVADL